MITSRTAQGLFANHSLVAPQIADSAVRAVLMVAIGESRAGAAAVAAREQALAELGAGRVTSAPEAEGAAASLRSEFGPVAPDVATVLLGASHMERGPVTWPQRAPSPLTRY